jgi:uncharacterized protein
MRLLRLALVAGLAMGSACRTSPPAGPDPRSPESISKSIGARAPRADAPPSTEPSAPPAPATPTNRLADSRSPYLRSAASQPVAWQEWGSEAFDLAQKLDRPILLDVGAVWCHWCHVIDRESYEDPEIAALINERFVAVKVDRDERPDVDRRYQTLVSALGRNGGWPLTAFLTPDGKLITGGTYFPPVDRGGQPGMKSILPRIADLWRNERDDVVRRAKELLDHVQRQENEALEAGELDPKLLDALDDAIRSSYDAQHGGFGSEGKPKFPQGSVLEYALARSQITGDQELRQIALRTVSEMAKGGVRDQLGGAFHRYSTDDEWVLPHFEVMSYVNAEMLLASLQCFRASGDTEYRRVAEETMGWIDRVGSDRERGGFYSSQDADAGPDDDGGYWTWTRNEVEAATTPDEAAALCLYFDVGDQGEMARSAHGAPDRNVLHVARSPEEVAATLEKPVADVAALLASGRRKLLEVRSRRDTPLVDRNLVASWNGLLIVAYLEAADALDADAPRAFALKSLDRFLDRAYRKGEGVMHVVLDDEARVPGVLDDQVQIGLACVRAYEATGTPRYLAVAEDLARLLIDRYRDLERGGFFDRPVDASGPAVLSTRTKPVDDAPTPSGNGAAAMLLDRLYTITEKPIYREREDETLKAFAGTVKNWGLFVATFASALEQRLAAPPRVLVVGARSDAATQALARAARRAFRPGKIVLIVDPASAPSTAYPPDPKGTPLAYVCAGRSCAPPTNDGETLRQLVETWSLR